MFKMKIQLLILHLTVGLSFQNCEDMFGRSVQNGYTIHDGCVQLKCTDDKLVPDKDFTLDSCETCTAEGDPHFEAFSGARFDWHDGCNYALVQKGEGETPDFGVFMQFERIDSVAHVGGPVTYKENVLITVELFPDSQSTLYSVRVNKKLRQISHSTPTLLSDQSDRPTSVYAWRHSGCVRLYGEPRILVELCVAKITIWAPKQGNSFPVKLGGLCGSTGITALQEKSLVSRYGSPYPNPGIWGGVTAIANEAFGKSWKADEQFLQTCRPSIGKRKRSLKSEEIEADNIRRACGENTNNRTGNQDHHTMCLHVHKGRDSCTGDDHVDACIFDLCMAANGKEHKTSGFTVQKMLGHHTVIHARHKIHNDNSIAFVPFESSVSSKPVHDFGRPQPVVRPVTNRPIRTPFHQTVPVTSTRPAVFGFNGPVAKRG